MRTYVVRIDAKYKVDRHDDRLREVIAEGIRDEKTRKPLVFYPVGQRVILLADKTEGFPEERGVIC